MSKSAKPIFKRKKWADTEIQKLLKYLLEQEEFEKPTAQVFYRTFLATCDIDATWDIIRWKVRYLKTTYIKAESWRRTTEAKLLETNEGALALQDTLRKRCRFYDELHRIFGNKISDMTFDETTNSSMELNSTENTYESEHEFCGFKVTDMAFSTPDIHIKSEPLAQENEYDEYEIIDPETVLIDTNIQPKNKTVTNSKSSTSNNSPDLPTSAESERNPLLKRKLEFEKRPQTDESYSTPNIHHRSQILVQEDEYDGYEIIDPETGLIDVNIQQKNKTSTNSESITSNNSLDLLSDAQSERNSLLKRRLEFEKERFKMEFELKRRKFEEEIKERKEKLELKKLEMEMNERLRILELQKQERIATLEIEMRYKYGNRKMD